MYTAVGRRPGKYEGNSSQLKAEVLHKVSLDGLAGEFGDVQYGGWFGLIIGTNNAWIVGEDNYGFFTIIREGKPAEIEARFVDMETVYHYEQDLINVDPTGMEAI